MSSEIVFYVVGRTSTTMDAPNTSPPQENWEITTWISHDKAYQRYSHFKDGAFAEGSLQQIYMACVTVDLFVPENNSTKLMFFAAQSPKKTVVYNKQDIVQQEVKKQSTIQQLASMLSSAPNPYENIPPPVYGQWVSAPSGQTAQGTIDFQSIFNQVNGSPDNDY